MFAKIAHQLQLFSLLLILLATIKYEPFFKILNQTESTFLITALVSFSFLLSLGRRNLIKSLLLGLCLSCSILCTVNNIYLYPTLGVLVLCLFTFGFFHFLDRKHSLIQDSSVSWLNLLLALVFLLISLLFSIKAKADGVSIYHLALLYSSLSVIHLAFKNLEQHLKFGFYLVSCLAALGVALFYTQNDVALKILSYLSVALAMLHFLYNTFKKKAVDTAESYYESLFSKPEPIVIGYFLGVAIVGTFFLQTPLAHTASLEKHGLLDSFFTALSAVCVTGLIVLDTPVDFSQFGQFIIILLIQLGGLGITTLSAWILLMLSSGRLSLTHEETIKNMSGYLTKIDVKAFLKRIVLYFIVLESIGALILFLCFLKYQPWSKALWMGVFTSISAFCNAGFALNSDSLIAYQNNSVILFTISVLIIMGGFAPLMALDVFKKFRRPKFSVQEKIVISSTFILLISGFFFYLLVEWSQSLKDLSLLAKISNSWLQSATTRTAGFNSVDLTESRSITQMFMIFLMFIGGNPGSAAGGIKTVTIAILAITAASALKDNDEVVAFGKKIPHRTIYRASLIVFFSFGVHFIIFFLLSMTQNIDPISLMFETFSALGTVGLSVGATAQLDEIGKIIIIISMLAGRVGPLTFILLLMKRNSKQKWKTPEEDVFIT
jgi:trk system potassium uptake protein TrkH